MFLLMVNRNKESIEMLLTTIQRSGIIKTVKGGATMAERKAFNTSIDNEILRKFKAECALQGQQMNKLLEDFMQGYVDGEFYHKLHQKSNEDKGK